VSGWRFSRIFEPEEGTVKNVLVVTLGLVFGGVQAGAQERNVLVEMFTNSHCGLCPPAHTALKSYGASSPNAPNIRYIFYHVPFPYPDDPLAQVGSADAAGRNTYYGPFSATPVTFFDGVNQGTAYAAWGMSLNNRVSVASSLAITLEGSKGAGGMTVTATIQAVGSLPSGALAIHFVVVENVSYTGRNGVTPQNFVMREMAGGPAGAPLTIGPGETKVVERTSGLGTVTTRDNSGMVVFVQEVGTRAVLQSEYIAYGVLTGVEEGGAQPASFRLEQNFPNPFNPETRILYTLAGRERADGSRSGVVSQATTLIVYDLLGREVAVLVDEVQESGTYAEQWDAAGVPSGVYVYQLKWGDQVQTRRMVLIR
jgi:hypothetical protein